MGKVNDEGRKQMEVCLIGEESINFVKSKFTDRIITAYKLLGITLTVAVIFSIILLVSFVKCDDGKCIIYLLLLFLMVIPFAIIIQGGNALIEFAKKQRQDYEEGIVLLRQAKLKWIYKENSKYLKFCFTDDSGNSITYRNLTCFRYKYSEELELNQIRVDCRKCIVYLSGLCLLSKTV